MRFTLFIALRYLFSKKTRNVINIITAISMITVCIVTASLVILLSAFNGLEGKIEEVFSAFDPDLKVQPLTGKTIPVTQEQLSATASLEGVEAFSRVVEESVLFVYNGQQYLGVLKGVDNTFPGMVRLDTIVRSGSPLIISGRSRYAVIGDEVATALGVNLNDPSHFLEVYYPKRGKMDLFNPFRESTIMPGGVFDLQQTFNRHVIVPIAFAENLTGYDNEATSLEIALKPGAGEGKVKRELKKIWGGNITVKNRYEQQELMYKVLRSEKLAMFLIVTLILVIGSFNLISALTMLVVEKKKDIMVLWSLGATFRKVKSVYVLEGTLVALIGAVGGLVIGTLVTFAQQQFGFVKLGDSPEAPPYPVAMKAEDFLSVFFTVLAIGFIASWLRMKGIRLSRPDNYTLLK